MIRGVLSDGEGTPVPDGLVETWQAGTAGRFDHPDDPRGAVSRQPGHGADPVLAWVPAERRQTLIAEPVEGGYRFDIRLQGEGETVFFEV